MPEDEPDRSTVMPEDEPEQEFDFGSKKKSKKKQKKEVDLSAGKKDQLLIILAQKQDELADSERKGESFEIQQNLQAEIDSLQGDLDALERASEGKAEEESGYGPTLVETIRKKGEVYTYDDLLMRLYQIIEDENPSLGSKSKTTLQPPQVVRVGSKKVGWVNFHEICDMMKRPTEHVTQFVLAEFGTEGSATPNGQLILKGRYQPKHCESLLRKYIKEFVTCGMCKSKNTRLERDSSTRLHLVSCDNCNASRTAQSIKSGYHAVTRADRRAAKQAK